jgi:hypothetical protein
MVAADGLNGIGHLFPVEKLGYSHLVDSKLVEMPSVVHEHLKAGHGGQPGARHRASRSRSTFAVSVCPSGAKLP